MVSVGVIFTVGGFVLLFVCAIEETIKKNRAERAADKLRAALQEAHDHQSQSCSVFFEEGGNPVPLLPVDLGEAYQDSAQCERAVDALKRWPKRGDK